MARIADILLHCYSFVPVSSSEHFSAKLVLGDFYKAVEFVADCSREIHQTRSSAESIGFHGTPVKIHCSIPVRQVTGRYATNESICRFCGLRIKNSTLERYYLHDPDFPVAITSPRIHQPRILVCPRNRPATRQILPDCTVDISGEVHQVAQSRSVNSRIYTGRFAEMPDGKLGRDPGRTGPPVSVVGWSDGQVGRRVRCLRREWNEGGAVS